MQTDQQKPENTTDITDSLMQEILAEKPIADAPPEPNVVDGAPTAAPINPPDSRRDSSGFLYDSTIHYLDDSGNPVLTKTGKFRRRHKNSSRQELPSTITDLSQITARPGAIMMVESLLATSDVYGSILFGEFWKSNDTENTILLNVWSRYVTYKNWDLGQGVLFPILVATVPFLGVRLFNPDMLKRLKQIKEHFSGRNKVNTEQAATMKDMENANTDNRNKTVGENDPSQSNSIPLSGKKISDML